MAALTAPQSADNSTELGSRMTELGVAARAAAHELAQCSIEIRNAALLEAACAMREGAEEILGANALDMAGAEERGLSAAMLDRLKLDPARIEAMAAGLEGVAELPDPLGRVLANWTRPNGLEITRVAVPIGVIGIIYESRPNVTADAAGLCVKSGNAAILRPGSESFNSSSAILACLHAGLAAAGVPAGAVQMVPTRDRAAVGLLLRMDGAVDLIVPRGGRGLIERIMDESRIPVFAHLDGICHVYVHDQADPAMARDVLFNAKMRRTGICGAAETLLIDRAIAGRELREILDPLVESGCELRGDGAACAIDARLTEASEADWETEYLDAILAVRVVDGLDDAIEHVNRHGSHHTDSIVTADSTAAARFLDEVDSGIVMHNCSTQFADGGEFGMGAEIGISTGKLHARGPVGAEQLTTYKYRVQGSGQVRP
jgi:glutamate-5-semialdehyde dehydrogenase